MSYTIEYKVLKNMKQSKRGKIFFAKDFLCLVSTMEFLQYIDFKGDTLLCKTWGLIDRFSNTNAQKKR